MAPLSPAFAATGTAPKLRISQPKGLKLKRYAEAIAICNGILAANDVQGVRSDDPLVMASKMQSEAPA